MQKKKKSFCAKSCEAKTAEAGGEPDFRTSKERKQDNAAPALEPTRNSLALMQTVVMSFARGLYLGKPELPIDHVHVYFPVQIVHKVIAQCKALKLKEIALAAAERYKHNLDNAANNPYVIVGVFEGKCSHERLPQPWRERMKKGCLMRVLDRLSPLPPFTKQAFV